MLGDNRWFIRSSPYVQQVLTAGCILSVSAWEMSEESIIQRQGTRLVTFLLARPRVSIQYLNTANVVSRWSGSSWNQFGQRRTQDCVILYLGSEEGSKKKFHCSNVVWHVKPGIKVCGCQEAKRLHSTRPGNYDLSLRVNDTFFNTAKTVQAGSYHQDNF